MAELIRGRFLAMRNGSTDRGSADWPSAVLHELAPAMAQGLDKRRLRALASFIEGLELMPEWGTSGAPGPLGYYLSGYGLVCWGWGEGKGMNAVADNGYVNRLQDMLTAEPVRLRQVPGLTLWDVTPRHVADAIRQFCESEDAGQAWYMASGLREEAPPAQAPSLPVEPKAPVPVQAAVPAAALTGNEEWKRLIMADDFTGMKALAQKKVAEVAAKMEVLEAERVRWAKRHKVAEQMEQE